MSAQHVVTGQLPLPITLDEGATFENFHAGPNGAAVEALKAVAADGPQMIFVHGADGTGKSHLLQAACRAAMARERRAVYLPMGQAVLLDPSAVENFENYALVCIDDMHRLAGAESWQRALLALFDALKANGGSFVSGARGAPNTLKRFLPDLVSRLSWGPVFQLAALGDADKILALQQRAARRGFELPDDTAKFLLNRLQRDMSTLCASVGALDAASLAAQRKLTVPFVKSFLEKR
jgi:DnaA-homolog protein